MLFASLKPAYSLPLSILTENPTPLSIFSGMHSTHDNVILRKEKYGRAVTPQERHFLLINPNKYLQRAGVRIKPLSSVAALALSK